MVQEKAKGGEGRSRPRLFLAPSSLRERPLIGVADDFFFGSLTIYVEHDLGA
jgi:hypothetical protein